MMGVTRADLAAADLAARIVHEARHGLLAGVEAEVQTVSGKQLRIVLTRLPPGYAMRTEQGLAPTVAGARVTDFLHHLAKRACDHAGLTRPSQFLVRPDVLAASAGASFDLHRRVS